MKTAPHILREREAHHRALESLAGPGNTLSGLSLWRKLRRIEATASRAATAQCNGTAFEGQPFRDYDAMDEFCADLLLDVAQVLSLDNPPAGIFINRDPRGYALKIDPERGTIPPGMVRDWGGYGIIAAEIH